jgi:hypothetical protein
VSQPPASLTRIAPAPELMGNVHGCLQVVRLQLASTSHPAAAAAAVAVGSVSLTALQLVSVAEEVAAREADKWADMLAATEQVRAPRHGRHTWLGCCCKGMLVAKPGQLCCNPHVSCT